MENGFVDSFNAPKKLYGRIHKKLKILTQLNYFLIQTDSQLIPVEIKPNNCVSGKSLSVYQKNFLLTSESDFL